MMIKIAALLTVILFTTLSTLTPVSAQDDNDKKYFLGSTGFILANFAPDPPNYYQLNLGYRITPKDVVSIEAITWEYKGPLGRPYGKDFDNEASNYPGFVQAYGIGFSYKRFLWESLYTAFHTTFLHQNYLDENSTKIQSGFQIFNTARIGYQLKFFKNSFFIEPSIAATYWPINTNLPKSFQTEEDKWNNYFLLEPGLHFGINF